LRIFLAKSKDLLNFAAKHTSLADGAVLYDGPSFRTFSTVGASCGTAGREMLARLGVARANALQAKTSQGADADAARDSIAGKVDDLRIDKARSR
jgi:hypothetical protein